MSSPASDALRRVAKDRAEAPTQRVGGYPPGPHDRSELVIAYPVPFHALQICRRKQEFSRERVRDRLMLICVALGDPVVVMTPHQVAQLVSYIPVFAEPVARGGHGDDRPTSDSERVCGRKLRQAYHVNAQKSLQPVCERSDKVRPKDLPN